MKLIKAMLTVGGLTGLSRIFGFVRDILMAAILGAGPVADAFFVALKLPNFFRRVTAEGAFSVSFVPVFSETLARDGREEADKFALNAFAFMLYGLGLFSIVVIAAMPWVMYVVAPGFEVGELRYDLAVELSRITFPYLLLMSLTALLGGVLNALGKFAPFAFAPVLFNLTLIAALLMNDLADSAGHALAWGVLIAGGVQFVWLVVSAWRSGLHLKLIRPKLAPRIKRVFKLMGPGVIGAGVMHINLFTDLIIGSFLSAGSISYLYYADRLNQLPLGVVGIAVGTALLPMLSNSLANNNQKEARHLFNRALEFCLLLALPAAVALATMPHVLVSVLFERGAFGAEATQATSLVLMSYAIGLPAYIAIKVFSTAHWARQDTITPVKISVLATVLNVILSIILVQFIGVAGVALGTALTGWLQFALHIRALKEYPAAHFDDRFLRVISRIVLASCIMGAALYYGAAPLLGMAGGSELAQAGALAVIVIGGMALYGAGILATGAVRISEIKGYLSKGNIR